MAQQQCQIAIPGFVSPGQKFTATTPDGQQMEVEVPPGAAPGSNVTFFFTPLENLGNQPVATVVGQPVVGQPVSGGGGPHQMDASRADNEASMLGWTLYATGWAMCCCFGPVGLIFWSIAPCIFFSKPKDVQRGHPQERTVAMINCVTCGVCTCIGIIMIVLIVVVVATGSAMEDEKCENDYQVNDPCEDCTISPDGYDWGRRRNGYCWSD